MEKSKFSDFFIDKNHIVDKNKCYAKKNYLRITGVEKQQKP
jgi:hypothetical protein